MHDAMTLGECQQELRTLATYQPCQMVQVVALLLIRGKGEQKNCLTVNMKHWRLDESLVRSALSAGSVARQIQVGRIPNHLSNFLRQ